MNLSLFGLVIVVLLSSCSDGKSESNSEDDAGEIGIDAPISTDAGPMNVLDAAEQIDGGASEAGIVQVVLFTHIEDQTPGGDLGTSQSRRSYEEMRSDLLDLAALMDQRNLVWVLQPDWKFLEAALLYEDEALTADTNGQNVFVYLREHYGTFIDPHSHEAGGYNYTDVAYLLEQLGVGGSTVIGGHIWDPSLPQFADWERFREPVPGQHYPDALWRGDILMGAATPGHTNDPLVSGLWRPLDRDHFFDDDPNGNIASVGMWHDDVAGVEELIALYESGTVPSNVLLTAGWNISPDEFTAEGGLATVDETILAPMEQLQAEGKVLTTDFTSLIEKWRNEFDGEAFLYEGD